MYELKGWAFYRFSQVDLDLDTKKEIKNGVFVKDWEEAHKLMAQTGFEYYLIALTKIKGEK